MLQVFTVRAVAALGISGLFLLLGSGCSQDRSHGNEKPPAAAVKVIVAKPVERPVTDFVDFTGRTESVQTVEIRSRVSGYLTKVEFMGSLDSEVAEGDLLFEIDSRPYENTLAAAEAKMASAKAKLKTSSAELDRTEGLFKKGVVAQSELDRDVGLKAQADADILAADASLSQAKLELEFTKIKSPIAGKISRPNFTVGNLVTPTTGPLTTVVSVDPMYVYYDLDEPTLLKIQKNVREGKLASKEDHTYKVLLGLANDNGYPYTGKLDFVDNRVDPNTGTIRVRGVFENPKPERGDRPLTAGLFARVRVPLGTPHPALLVSEQAIGRTQGVAFVYVVNADNEIVYRRVTLGSLHDGVRVIEEGLTAGERIVINGLQRVHPGSKVDPEEKSMIEELPDSASSADDSVNDDPAAPASR